MSNDSEPGFFRTHSTGHGTGIGNATLLANPELCTLQTCDMTLAAFYYLPTVAGNALYAGIFGVYIVVQLYLGIKHKTWGYMLAMVLGLVRPSPCPFRIKSI
jgi:hypothetical protein